MPRGDFIDVGDRDRDVLSARVTEAVCRDDRHVVDVVGADVGRVLEVACGEERQDASAGDVESRPIGAAGRIAVDRERYWFV